MLIILTAGKRMMDPTSTQCYPFSFLQPPVGPTDQKTIWDFSLTSWSYGEPESREVLLQRLFYGGTKKNPKAIWEHWGLLKVATSYREESSFAPIHYSRDFCYLGEKIITYMFKSKYSFHFAKHNGQSWELNTQFSPSPNHSVMLWLQSISYFVDCQPPRSPAEYWCYPAGTELWCSQTKTWFLKKGYRKVQLENADIKDLQQERYQTPCKSLLLQDEDLLAFSELVKRTAMKVSIMGKILTEMSAKTTTEENTCQAGNCRQKHPWHAHLDTWKCSWVLKSLKISPIKAKQTTAAKTYCLRDRR